jgi:hypothetical protein
MVPRGNSYLTKNAEGKPKGVAANDQSKGNGSRWRVEAL